MFSIGYMSNKNHLGFYPTPDIIKKDVILNFLIIAIGIIALKAIPCCPLIKAIIGYSAMSSGVTLSIITSFIYVRKITQDNGLRESIVYDEETDNENENCSGTVSK